MTKPEHTEALKGIWLKIERANKHIAELSPIVQRFFETHRHRTLVEVNAATGQKHIKVSGIKEAPPAEVSVICGEVLYLLRSALDHIVTLAGTRNGHEVIERTGFPIESTRDKFEDTIRSRKIEQRLPELANVLRSLEPYEGGNNQLWWLHWLNGKEKHKALVAIAGSRIPGSFEFRTQRNDGVVGMGPIHLVQEWFRHDEDQTVAVLPADSGEVRHANVELLVNISFGEIEALQFKPVQETLTQLSDLTSGIVKIFEDRFFK